jgi:hypothetical protein
MRLLPAIARSLPRFPTSDIPFAAVLATDHTVLATIGLFSVMVRSGELTLYNCYRVVLIHNKQFSY